MIYDPHNGESKSRLILAEFGYVEFESEQTVNEVLAIPTHYLHNKLVSVQLPKGKQTAQENFCQPTQGNTDTFDYNLEDGYIPATGVLQYPDTPIWDYEQNGSGPNQMCQNTNSTLLKSQWDHGLIGDYERITKKVELAKRAENDNCYYHIQECNQIYDSGQMNFLLQEEDGYASSQIAKTRRPYKLFYKNLKRPHIKNRAIRKQEDNYVYHISRSIASYGIPQNNLTIPIQLRRNP